MGTFSERLRASMDAANMKAVELHGRTGISKDSISEYLSGNYEPKQRNIFKIVQALNVSPSYLMGLMTIHDLLCNPPHPPRAICPIFPTFSQFGQRKSPSSVRLPQVFLYTPMRTLTDTVSARRTLMLISA